MNQNQSLHRDQMVRKTSYAIVLIALGAALSPFTSFPLGIARVNPTQHFLNVLLSTLLGLRWSVGGATVMALIRNLLGTGTLLAFPGGIFGALLSGLLYRLTGRYALAALGEVIGTSIVGTLVSALWVAPSFLGKTPGLLALGASFFASSLLGALTAFIVLGTLSRASLLPRLNWTRRDGSH